MSRRGPGPFFTASYDDECSACGDDIVTGEVIRADGSGGWEHQDCVEDEDQETERNPW